MGLGLVDQQGGDPVVVTVPPSLLINTPVPDVTGNNPGPQRILAGQVADPLLGAISAVGYIDFQTPATISDAFRSGPVEEATLILARDYRFGDTTSTVMLTLHDMVEEWDPTNARADTVLSFGTPVLLTATLDPDRPTATLALPPSWITAQDATLRAETFSTDFHGFALAPVSGNDVLGFSPVSTLLRVVSNGDTTFFPVSKTLTALSRSDDLQLPPGRILLQDGSGPGIEISFDFEQEGLALSALNRAVLRFTADTLFLAQEAPPHVVRPLVRRFTLAGVTASGLRLAIQEADLAADGSLTFSSQSLNNVVQSMLLKEDIFTRFQLSVPPGENTLNPILFHANPGDSDPPRAVLTITRAAN